MIYGNIDFNTSSTEGISGLRILENGMIFKDCKHAYIHSEIFTGGYFISNRLAIDSEEYIYQSTKNKDVLILDGDIFNQQELLSYYDISPNKYNISELLYYLFSIEGPSFINRLNGEFAIAIYHSSKEKLYLFTDHIGTRPLSYGVNKKTKYFSSSATILCQLFMKPGEDISKAPLLKYFKLIDYTQSLHRDVKKLLPGHYLEISSDKETLHKYWYPEQIRINHSLKRRKMLNDMEELLFKAINNRYDNRYTAGSHLSGGLDSGIVSAISRKAFKRQSKFYGFSWSPKIYNHKITTIDERNLIREQCELNNTIPVFLKIQKEDYLKYVSLKFKSSDFIEEKIVLDTAKENGINLMFSGYGGDEFISKNDRGIDLDLLINFQWKYFFKRNNLKNPRQFIYRVMDEVLFPFIGIIPPSVRKTIKKEGRYLKKDFKKSDRRMKRNFFLYRSRRSLQLGFIYCYYLSDRMEDWYLNGARNGIEYRYPLLDKNIIEYALKIPSKLLIKGEYSRSIIREISDGLLPDSIRWRKSFMDPVSFDNARKNVQECGLEFASEIEDFKNNSDIDFIDFDKLNKDLDKFNLNPDYEKFTPLLFTLFDIKRIHEFTKAFRQKPGEET